MGMAVPETGTASVRPQRWAELGGRCLAPLLAGGQTWHGSISTTVLKLSLSQGDPLSTWTSPPCLVMSHHGKQVSGLSSGTFSKQVAVQGPMGVILWSLGRMTWAGPCGTPTGLGLEWHLAVPTSCWLPEVRAELLRKLHWGPGPQAALEGPSGGIPAAQTQRAASGRA